MGGLYFMHTLMQNIQSILNSLVNILLIPPISLVDGGGLRTFFCDPMHMLRSSGYTLSGIYIDDLRTSPRRIKPENQFISLRILAIHGAKTTKNQTPLLCFA